MRGEKQNLLMLRTVLFFINLKKRLLHGNGRRLICSYPAVLVTFGATGSAVNLVNHLCPVNAAPHRADVRHKKAKQPTGKATACCRCLSAGVMPQQFSAIHQQPPLAQFTPFVFYLLEGRTSWNTNGQTGRAVQETEGRGSSQDDRFRPRPHECGRVYKWSFF